MKDVRIEKVPPPKKQLVAPNFTQSRFFTDNRLVIAKRHKLWLNQHFSVLPAEEKMRSRLKTCGKLAHTVIARHQHGLALFAIRAGLRVR